MRSLRELPSVDRVLRALPDDYGFPPDLVVNEIRAVLAQFRKEISAGGHREKTIEELVTARLAELDSLALQRVINATGVILHTNLGRAPLPSFDPIFDYCNLEYDLHTGRRGKRDDHIADLLKALLGSPAIAVNNNAAAVYLVLNELAAGGEVIVSRGELIEIGDGFRIPEIMERAGVVLREVGTTNRTHIEDYRRAITDRTRLLLRVHPSNFRVCGFTSRPSLRELVELGREFNLPVYEDLGSGCVVDLEEFGIHEPLVSDSLAAGVHVVSFSCDKLMGGPQAGFIAGHEEYVVRIRRNPMYRAFRLDKLILQSLAVTVRHLLRKDWRAVPVLDMISCPVAEIEERARKTAAALEELHPYVRPAESPIGGGSTPDQSLPSWVVDLAVESASTLAGRLRRALTPVIARIENDAVVLDFRTVREHELTELVSSVRQAGMC